MVVRNKTRHSTYLVGFGLESRRRRFTQLAIAFIRARIPPHTDAPNELPRARCGRED